jgi:hypothetical protein
MNCPIDPIQPRLLPDYACAERYRVHLETAANWARRGWVTAYVEGDQLWLDIDEIEAAFKIHPRMKDGRRSKWPASANVRPLPLPPRRQPSTTAEVER